MSYLHADQIEAKVQDIATRFKSICKTVPLAPSPDRRRITALQIRQAPGDAVVPRVLITAGMHAREWAPPDALLNFVDALLTAYSSGSQPLVDSAFAYDRVMASGNQPVTVNYDKYEVPYSTVKQIVEKLDIYVLPMVNPDGREFSLTRQPFWRKNRKTTSRLQLITFQTLATGGTYTLTFAGATTGDIAFDADPADIQVELIKLATVANVSVEYAFPGLFAAGYVVDLTPAAGVPRGLMTTRSSLVVGLPGIRPRVFVSWGEGVDINRNFDIAFLREEYYSFAGEFCPIPGGGQEQVTGSPDFKDDTYRGEQALSEIETQNVDALLLSRSIGYYLDIHAYAGKILVPWAIETSQSNDPTKWFGSKDWDRNSTRQGRDGIPGTEYEEWFPNIPPFLLLNEHMILAGIMAAQIEAAAGSDLNAKAASTYEVRQCASGLYPATGTSMDHAFSRQFLPSLTGIPTSPNPFGNRKFALTFEAGSDLDGGFFPDQSTNQFRKVQRDIYGGLIGLLLKISS